MWLLQATKHLGPESWWYTLSIHSTCLILKLEISKAKNNIDIYRSCTALFNMIFWGNSMKGASSTAAWASCKHFQALSLSLWRIKRSWWTFFICNVMWRRNPRLSKTSHKQAQSKESFKQPSFVFLKDSWKTLLFFYTHTYTNQSTTIKRSSF